MPTGGGKLTPPSRRFRWVSRRTEVGDLAIDDATPEHDTSLGMGSVGCLTSVAGFSWVVSAASCMGLTQPDK